MELKYKEAIYTAFKKVWASPNLFTRIYTRLEVVWDPRTKYCGAKPFRCRYRGIKYGENHWKLVSAAIDMDDKEMLMVVHGLA